MPSILHGAENRNAFGSWTFPSVQLIFSIFALLVCFVENKINFENSNDYGNFESYSESKNFFLWLKGIFKINHFLKSNFFVSTMTFISISGFSIVLQIVAYSAGYSGNQLEVTKPQDFIQIFFCILTFAAAALFEELIFRFYLSDAIAKLMSCGISRKIGNIFSEIIAAVLFSLCHRYLGIFAVINALFAHVAFRICYKKTDSLLFPFAVHFVYNMINLAFCS